MREYPVHLTVLPSVSYRSVGRGRSETSRWRPAADSAAMQPPCTRTGRSIGDTTSYSWRSAGERCRESSPDCAASRDEAHHDRVHGINLPAAFRVIADRQRLPNRARFQGATVHCFGLADALAYPSSLASDSWTEPHGLHSPAEDALAPCRRRVAPGARHRGVVRVAVLRLGERIATSRTGEVGRVQGAGDDERRASREKVRAGVGAPGRAGGPGLSDEDLVDRSGGVGGEGGRRHRRAGSATGRVEARRRRAQPAEGPGRLHDGATRLGPAMGGRFHSSAHREV